MNKYYENYLKQRKERILNREKVERSFSEQMKPVKIAGELGKVLIHILSFSSAVILPAYGFELLFGSFSIGLAIGAILFLTFVEVPKWAIINTFFENYFDYDIKSYALGLLALVLITISILSSTFGVPIAVNRLSPEAKTISIEGIEDNKQKEVNSALAYWNPQIEKHNNDAKDYFKKYKKIDNITGEIRLSSSKRVRQPYNNMLNAAQLAQNKLNNKLDSIDSKYKAILLTATKDNRVLLAQHTYKKDNAGFIAMWVMLILELSYILIVWGLKYYDDRSTKEITETNTETRTHKRTTPTKTKVERLTNTSSGTPRPVIAGFQTDNSSNSFRTCSNCATDISDKRSDAKFCSTKCRGLHHKAKK